MVANSVFLTDVTRNGNRGPIATFADNGAHDAQNGHARQNGGHALRAALWRLRSLYAALYAALTATVATAVLTATATSVLTATALTRQVDRQLGLPVPHECTAHGGDGLVT